MTSARRCWFPRAVFCSTIACTGSPPLAASRGRAHDPFTHCRLPCAATADRRFALCTPGSDGQVQFLVQTLLALSDGDSLTVALDRPRVRTVDGRLAVEDDLDPAVLRHLEARGHEVWLRPPGEARFGAMVAAGVEHATGALFAAADPRREAWAVAL